MEPCPVCGATDCKMWLRIQQIERGEMPVLLGVPSFGDAGEEPLTQPDE